MKIAYFDLISGASGDMILGALVDAGLPFTELRDARELAGAARIRANGRARNALARSRPPRSTSARSTPFTRAVWPRSARSSQPAGYRPTSKNAPCRVFQRMAEAEAGIHGVPVETIHFHELGAVDTIVDVTGALLALEGLGVGRVISSPVPLGRGMARSAHGAMPLPAPATVALAAWRQGCGC